jgi:hypothetical protein
MTTTLTTDIHYNAEVTLKDGSTVKISANQLYDKNLHHWQGWLCNAGVDSIVIDWNFEVYGGQCRNDYLGNLFDEDFSWLASPTVCKQDSCTSCASDLYANKKDPNF